MGFGYASVECKDPKIATACMSLIGIPIAGRAARIERPNSYRTGSRSIGTATERRPSGVQQIDRVTLFIGLASPLSYPDCRLVSVYMGVYNFRRSFLVIVMSDRLRSFTTSDLHKIKTTTLASKL